MVSPDDAVPPILLIVFNRPAETTRALERIRSLSPRRLYVSGDGPRLGEGDDRRRCEAVRHLVEGFDADFEVFTRWSDANLGIAVHPPTAISWFFEHEDRGVILEDDCLPSPDFLVFARDMLEKYERDDRVMIVSGFNVRGSWDECDGDYFYSNLGGIWGWASWRRAWVHFDQEMKGLEDFIESGRLADLLGESLASLREAQFMSVRSGEVVTWDIPWGFSRNLRGGLAVVPRVSLIENIGFSPDATNTTAPSHLAKIRAGRLVPPFRGPLRMAADGRYDEIFFERPKTPRRVRDTRAIRALRWLSALVRRIR